MHPLRRRTRSLAVAVFVALAWFGGLAWFPGVASAHVKYVTPGSDPVAVGTFLADALGDPFNLAVLGASAVAGVATTGLYLRVRPFRADVVALRDALSGYRDLLPWLLRLSVGLPLVGAGFAGYFFAPVVRPASPAFVRLFGVALGFLLLFGLATRLVAAVGLASYLVALAIEPALFLAFEYVPAFLAIVLVGGGRPSADDVVADLAADTRTFYSRLDPFYRTVAVPAARRLDRLRPFAPTVLRAGLGVVFVYLGVSQKVMNPGDSLAVVAKYDLTAVIPVAPELWVLGAGLTEALVGVALAVGLFTRAFAGVAFTLFTLTLFGLPDDPVLAHISLFGLVSALMVTGGGPLSVDAAIGARGWGAGTTIADPDAAD